MRLSATRGRVSGSGGAVRSLLARALSAIRRLGGTALYVPDDYGLVLGPELVTNGTFGGGLAGWVENAPGHWSVVGGRAYHAFSGLYKELGQTLSEKPAGPSYKISIAYEVVSGSAQFFYINAANVAMVTVFTGASGVVEKTITDGIKKIGISRAAGGGEFYVDNISVREILSATTFIDSTGTQPVTAVGDLVGLLTDRSYGASNLGVELVTNGDFSGGATGWTLANSATVSSGQLTLPGANATAISTAPNCVSGKAYQFQFDYVSGSGAQFINVQAGSASFGVATTTTARRYSVIIRASAADAIKIWQDGGAAGSAVIDNISVREVLGNAATQPTTASKPLVTRVPKRLGPNLVSNGGFDSDTSGWSVIGGNPAGGMAVVGGELVFTGNGGSWGAARRAVTTEIGKTYQATAFARRGTTTSNASLTLASTVATTSSTTSTQLSVLQTASGSTLNVEVGISSATGSGTAIFDNVEVREVLEWTPALDFDGSNDLLTLSSGAILQQGSDHFVTAAFVLDVVGVQQTIYGASSTASVTPLVCVINTLAGNQLQAIWRDDAAAAVTIQSVATLSAGVPYVATAAKIGGSYYLWLNGTLAASASATLGATTLNTANTGALVRTTTGNYLNGKLIDLVVDQGTLTEADRILIETNMAKRCRAQYAVSTPTLSLDFTSGSYSVSDGEI